jgi:alpha-N-arabinofuranosidase
LTNRNNTARDLLCTGHGDLFQDYNGAWHMVHLGTRPVRGWNSNLGRETFLSPLVWKNDWPLVGDNGICKMEFEIAENVEQKKTLPWKASFSKEKLDPKWIFLRKPNLDSYFFDGETLTLWPSVTEFTDDASPTFIAVRQPDIECVFETIFDFTPEEEGDEAGVILYLNSLFHCRIGKKRIDTRDFLIVQKNAEDIKETSFIEKSGPERLWIRIEAGKEYYSFSFSRDGLTYNPMCKASTRLLCVEVTGRCFTGMTMGLYALCSSKTNAAVKFYSVGIKPCI